MLNRNNLLELCWHYFGEAVIYMETYRFSGEEEERQMAWNLFDMARHLLDYPYKTEAYDDLASQIVNCTVTWLNGGKISHIFVMNGTQ